MKQLVFVATLCSIVSVRAQAFSAAELLDRSIAYHDPQGKWSTFQGSLLLRWKRLTDQSEPLF